VRTPRKAGSIIAVIFLRAAMASAAETATVKVDWSRIQTDCRTTLALQVVVNPLLRRGTPIHDEAFAELRRLGADYVRYVPWLPYPKLAVAELEPPANGKTSWDFSLIDPMTEDFLNATTGHPVILNFSTIPQWMFRTPKPVPYPRDPNQVTWTYTQGTELRDPTRKELAGYYARLVSWYVNGGFNDEYGKRHVSGHHYNIDYWEVLNEVDFEHSMTPQQYTARYDAIVSAIRKVAPKMKFVGLALAAPSSNPEMFEYFLNPKHHKPGIPLDMISYHFYATPSSDETPEVEQFTFFDQADRFLATVRYIESIRKRLSPETRTTIDEIGSILPDDGQQGRPDYKFKPIPASYWNLSGALYAYLYGELASLGIDVAGESQLVGYPTQFPSVSMVDWTTGTGNARFRVLQLIKDNIGRGDKVVAASTGSPALYAKGFLHPDGRKLLLLINRRDRPIQVTLPSPAARAEVVDQTTGGAPPAKLTLNTRTVPLNGLAVALVTLN
jgi:hypothetical protein